VLSEEKVILSEPSENEAKKYKMNVRHYKTQDEDAMTLL
jgi:hypothetical protein